MSETIIPNPNKPKQPFVNPMDRLGADITHKMLGIGKFWGNEKIENILGNPDTNEIIITNPINRLGFLGEIEKITGKIGIGGVKQGTAWAQLKYILEKNSLSFSQIERLIEKYLTYLVQNCGLEDNKKIEITTSLLDTNQAAITAQSEQKETLTGRNVYNKSEIAKRDIISGLIFAGTFFTGNITALSNPIVGKFAISSGINAVGSYNIAKNLGTTGIKITVNEAIEKINFEDIKNVLNNVEINQTDKTKLVQKMRNMIICCDKADQRTKIVEILAILDGKTPNENLTVDIMGDDNIKTLFEQNKKLDNLFNGSKPFNSINQGFAIGKRVLEGGKPFLKQIGNLCNNFGRKGEIDKLSEVDNEKAGMFRIAASQFLTRIALPNIIASIQNPPTSTAGLTGPQEVSPVLSISPENLFQKSLNALNNLFPGINTNVPANSYLARMIEETLNNSDKIPQGISPAHWTLQNWATGNKVTSEAFKSILNNPEFANLNGVRDLAHLNPNQIEILKNSLPLAQQDDFNLAFLITKSSPKLLQELILELLRQ